MPDTAFITWYKLLRSRKKTRPVRGNPIDRFVGVRH